MVLKRRMEGFKGMKALVRAIVVEDRDGFLEGRD